MPASIQSEAPVGAVLFLSDGSLAGDCGDNQVRIWDAASGQLKRSVTREKGRGALAGRDVLAVVRESSEIKLWDLASGTVLRQQTALPNTRTRGVALSANRQVLAATTRPEGNHSDDTVHLFSASGALKHSAPAGIGGIAAMALSADGSMLAASSFDTDFRAWNARNGELLVRVTELPLATFALEFSPDGRWLAAAGADRLVRLYDTKSWKIARTLTGQNEMVSTLAFSPDGRRLLTGGFNDLTVKHPVQVLLWDVASGAVVRRFEMPRRVNSVAFAPDGRLGAAALGEKTVPLLATA